MRDGISERAWAVLMLAGVSCLQVSCRKSTDSLLAEAKEAYQKGDYPTAGSICTKILRRLSMPEDKRANAHLLRGLVFMELGVNQPALRDFTQAIQYSPDNAKCYYLRGKVHIRSNRPAEALADFSKAIELEPGRASAYEKRGRLHHRIGDLSQALKDYDKAVELNPKSAHIFNHRGWVHLDLDHLHKAIADFTRAMELSPRYDWPLVNRCLAYKRMGEVQRAFLDCNEMIQRNTRSKAAGIAFRHRGCLHMMEARYDEAIADFNHAVEMDPSDSYAFAYRGYFHYHQGKYTRALGELQTALQLNPGDTYAVLFLALASARQEREWRSGLAAFLEHHLHDEKWPAPIFHFLLGRIGPQRLLSIAEHQEPKKKKERLCEAYYYLAQYCLLSGETEKAIEWFQKSLATGVRHFIEYWGSGAELTRLGQD